jgi:hypothetical protein
MFFPEIAGSTLGTPMRAAAVAPHPCDGWLLQLDYKLLGGTGDPIAQHRGSGGSDGRLVDIHPRVLADMRSSHARGRPRADVVVATTTPSRSLYGEPLLMD